jgi:ferrochelatase
MENQNRLPQEQNHNEWNWGFTAGSETWNGRLAMLGFVIGLGTELLTGQGILGQLGLG